MPFPLKKSFAAELLEKRKKKRPSAILVIAVIVAIAAVGYALYMRFGIKEIPTEETILKKPSIAVLPFRNMSDDKEDEYFSDGITEDIIAHLAKIGGLKVISSTSIMHYKDTVKSLPEIGKELSVDNILEGSVRRSDSRIRIVSQLIEAQTDGHIWVETFDRELKDVFAIQEEIAMAIAESLEVTLLGNERAAIEKRPTENQEAYELYLLGKHFIRMGEKGYEKGLECFQQAIDKDPDFALAYAGIALSYDWLGYVGKMPQEEAWPKARAAAEKALEIDDTLAEAHTVLADASFLYDWDWETAEKGFQRAIALNPGYSTAHFFYSYFLGIMGRMDEELLEIKLALEFDPLSPSLNSRLATLYCEMGRYDEAMEQIHRITEIDPNHIYFYRISGYFHFLQDNYKEAINAYQKSIELGGEYDFWLGYLYALSGERDKAVKILHELIEKKKANYYSSAKIAMVYAGLGETDKVFEWLEKAYDEHDCGLIDFIGYPHLKHLHSDKRYKALLKKIGLPEE